MKAIKSYGTLKIGEIRVFVSLWVRRWIDIPFLTFFDKSEVFLKDHNLKSNKDTNMIKPDINR